MIKSKYSIKKKSLNQFIECTRSKNGVVEDWDPGTVVQSDIFVYVNRGTDQECKMRVLGIAEAGTTVLDDTGSYYIQGDKLKVANLGSTALDERLSSWLYNVKKLIQVNEIQPGGLNNQTATVYTTNNHGLLVGDSVTIYGANPTIFNGTFAVTSRISDTIFSYQIAAPAPNAPQGNILMSVDLNKGKSDVEVLMLLLKIILLTYRTHSLIAITLILQQLVFPTIRLVRLLDLHFFLVIKGS